MTLLPGHSLDTTRAEAVKGTGEPMVLIESDPELSKPKALWEDWRMAP